MADQHPLVSLPAPLSRRRLLGTTGVALAAAALSETAVAQQAKNTATAEQGPSASDPGPENDALRRLNPSSFKPSTTDQGLVPQFWSSFSMMHRRIQDGGWSRQVNVESFPISKDIASVNMRLTAGGIRELHWHQANEWAIMLTGTCRLTAIDLAGATYVNDVSAGDLWYFPTGVPHSLQGLGPDGCEFLLVFDDGRFSEENTTLLSDWVVHTPRDVLAKNWNASADALDFLGSVPRAGRYIFQAAVPGDLDQDRQRATGAKPLTAMSFDFRTAQLQPQKSNRSGEVRIVDSTVFPVAENIAMAHVTLKPGGLRELHWHPNANEWQYYIQGKARMTLFHNRSTAGTTDFCAGDVGYVPQTLGHYIENTGDTDLVFLEMFHASKYEDFSLNEWLRHIPPELVMQHLDIPEQILSTIPAENVAVLPA
jgi:oxalate decarboxylase